MRTASMSWPSDVRNRYFTKPSAARRRSTTVNVGQTQAASSAAAAAFESPRTTPPALPENDVAPSRSAPRGERARRLDPPRPADPHGGHGSGQLLAIEVPQVEHRTRSATVAYRAYPLAMTRRPYARLFDGRGKLRLERPRPGDTAGIDKEEGVARTETLGTELAELENLLSYAGTHALLVVLQGRDASGKDRHDSQDPRFHQRAERQRGAPSRSRPRRSRRTTFSGAFTRWSHGVEHMALFNRSHYEDVLAARVHHLVPEAVWKARYGHINAFEQPAGRQRRHRAQVLSAHQPGRAVRARLRAREKDPRTAWKLNPGDWRELPLFEEMTTTYEDAIVRCTTRDAPWHLVPADRVVPQPGRHRANGAGAAPLQGGLAREPPNEMGKVADERRSASCGRKPNAAERSAAFHRDEGLVPDLVASRRPVRSVAASLDQGLRVMPLRSAEERARTRTRRATAANAQSSGLSKRAAAPSAREYRSAFPPSNFVSRSPRQPRRQSTSVSRGRLAASRFRAATP